MRAWGEERDWRGFDPYDALNSPAAGLLALGPPLGRRLFTQAVKLSPLNLRPALGIRPAWNAKALGLVASGYARLWAAERDERARVAALRWLAQLERMSTKDASGLGWGYHFPVQTRVFAYARETPNTIATSFVAQAQLDCWELLGDERARDAGVAAARFLAARMLAPAPTPYFRYLAAEDELVHNANLLACAVLARAARVAGASGLLEPVRRALEATLVAQREDGSWPYAAGAGHGWVDNFHTGYVLDSLAECARSLHEASEPLRRGVAFWSARMFLPDGTPKYTPDRIHPLDGHCYATAVDTWLAIAAHDRGAREQAERAARVLVEQALEPAGYVRFQRRRGWSSRVAFVRWTTAPAFRALAGVLQSRRAHLD